MTLLTVSEFLDSVKGSLDQLDGLVVILRSQWSFPGPTTPDDVNEGYATISLLNGELALLRGELNNYGKTFPRVIPKKSPG